MNSLGDCAGCLYRDMEPNVMESLGQRCATLEEHRFAASKYHMADARCHGPLD